MQYTSSSAGDDRSAANPGAADGCRLAAAGVRDARTDGVLDEVDACRLSRAACPLLSPLVLERVGVGVALDGSGEPSGKTEERRDEARRRSLGVAIRSSSAEPPKQLSR